jgi:hypothetical protein
MLTTHIDCSRAGLIPVVSHQFKGTRMDKREEELKKVKDNTPKTFSSNDVAGLLDDDEDWAIYERRCYDQERD